jgi:putative tricarboxylic transport membrane protein
MIGANVLAKAAPFVAIMGAAVCFYYLADHLDFDPMPGRAGPDLWPKMVLGLMILTCAIGIAKTFFTRASGGANLLTLLAPQAGEDIEEGKRSFPHLALLGCAAFIVYVLVLGRLGFVVSTAVLLAAFLWIGRYRNVPIILLTSLVGSLGFFFVFRKLVYVSLPLGREPFLTFSVWLMKLMGMS